MRRGTITTAAVVCAVAVGGGAATQAIGSGDSTATAAAKKAKTLRLKADAHGKTLRFNKKKLRVRAGKVRIVMKNFSKSIPHAIAVEGHGIDKDGKTVRRGGTSTVTVRLKKGRYEFYCPVAGHEKAGMKGTLIVR